VVRDHQHRREIYHRDLPKLCVRAWTAGTAPVAMIDGDEYDGVFVADRAHARTIGASARTGETVVTGDVARASPPYLGFTVAAADTRVLRRAEKQLVWSMRKQSRGSPRRINRHISLRVTRAIMRTEIRPNHVTVFCFLLALAGAALIGQGGWAVGLAGMALVNLPRPDRAADHDRDRRRLRRQPGGARPPGRRPWSPLPARDDRGAVLLCSYTTTVGYGALMLSPNGGIRAFGLAALICELACISMALLVAPALLAVLRNREVTIREAVVSDPSA
jgi:hypothetical protein